MLYPLSYISIEYDRIRTCDTSYLVGYCTVYLAAAPLAPQGISLRNIPLARVQFPAEYRSNHHRHSIYIKFPLYHIPYLPPIPLRHRRFSAVLPELPNLFGFPLHVQYLYRQSGFLPPHLPFSSFPGRRLDPPDPGSPVHR